MLVASTSVLASTALLLPLALRERRHRGLARLRIAVRGGCDFSWISRHERAVLPFKEGRMLVASTSVVGFRFRSGKAQNEQMFSGLPPQADLTASSRHVV